MDRVEHPLALAVRQIDRSGELKSLVILFNVVSRTMVSACEGP
jgi:hypothetical protein